MNSGSQMSYTRRYESAFLVFSDLLSKSRKNYFRKFSQRLDQPDRKENKFKIQYGPTAHLCGMQKSGVVLTFIWDAGIPGNTPTWRVEAALMQ